MSSNTSIVNTMIPDYSNPLLTCYMSYSLTKKRFQSHMNHLTTYSKILNKDIIKIILWKRTLWTRNQQMLMS